MLFNIQYALSGEMEKLCILNAQSKNGEACAKDLYYRDVPLKNTHEIMYPSISQSPSHHLYLFVYLPG